MIAKLKPLASGSTPLGGAPTCHRRYAVFPGFRVIVDDFKAAYGQPRFVQVQLMFRRLDVQARWRFRR